MDAPTIPLKKLPYAITKKQLFAMYLASGMTERQIRIGINAIIAENRKKSNSKPISERLIWHEEWKEFVNVYGVPAGGYRKEFLDQ